AFGMPDVELRHARGEVARIEFDAGGIGAFEPAHRHHRNVDVEEIAVDAYPMRGAVHIALRDHDEIGRKTLDIGIEREARLDVVADREPHVVYEQLIAFRPERHHRL